jgi:hypothetical protein
MSAKQPSCSGLARPASPDMPRRRCGRSMATSAGGTVGRPIPKVAHHVDIDVLRKALRRFSAGGAEWHTWRVDPSRDAMLGTSLFHGCRRTATEALEEPGPSQARPEVLLQADSAAAPLSCLWTPCGHGENRTPPDRGASSAGVIRPSGTFGP